ncbi:MAG: HAMP domain-containing protein, partial [Clostridia bacterium]|nr:HAMP domain-containing protein [Clostridia bacterium]
SAGVRDIVGSYAGPLGIDTYRFYAILDAKTGAVLHSSDPSKSANLEKSDNIITAMSGKNGNISDTEKTYMDYAIPINTNGSARYIAYIKDTKNEVTSVTRNVLFILIEALLVSVCIAVILSFFFSRTITKPIRNLTGVAEKIASGEFTAVQQTDAKDELGILSNTFSYMSTELSRTMEEVNSEKNKVETILNNMTDGILAFNTKGELIHINPKAKKMIGRQFYDDIKFDTFFKELDADISMGSLIYINDEERSERQATINDKIIRFIFAPFKIENKIGGILVVMHDITSQQKLEFSRREFVANVSHELRTPLTTVKSYAETLMDMPYDEEMHTKFLGTMANEADRMTRIVKDLLTLSRLDEGQYEVRPYEQIDLANFLTGVVERMFFSAKEKHQTLLLHAPNQNSVVLSDRDKLEQVVINIISNAIKYTPEGGEIDVYFGTLYKDAYIKVRDNGIGIPKENLPRIFERFYRVDKARSRETGGTGLGLAIAKQIMNQLGGNISITSDVGEGTEVIISIPI